MDRTRHGDDAGVAAYLTRLTDAVRTAPGVEAVGVVNRLPLGGQVQAGDVRVERHDAAVATNWRSVDAGYFAALRVPLVAGRGFDHRDTADAPAVGLVDERFAATFGGAAAVLGTRFRIDAPGADLPWVEIVGVVGHVRDEGLDRGSRPIVYWPLAQRTLDRMAMVVRSAAEPTSVAGAVRQAIRVVDAEQALADVRPMTAVIERSLETPRSSPPSSRCWRWPWRPPGCSGSCRH